MPIDGITFDNVVVSRNPPPAFQNLNRYTLFPGLAQPIQDQYMHPIEIWFYTILVAILAVGIAGLITMGFIRFFGLGGKEGSTSASEPLLEKEKEQSNWLLEHKTSIFIVGSIVIAVAVQYIVRTQEHTFDKTHYFACEGVVDGVATGNTWPVPSCFQDQTDSS
jgi:formate hydrogenlyase subunit 3/multisubunit Na+/H+ antiporter MnhD subunit